EQLEAAITHRNILIETQLEDETAPETQLDAAISHKNRLIETMLTGDQVYGLSAKDLEWKIMRAKNDGNYRLQLRCTKQLNQLKEHERQLLSAIAHRNRLETRRVGFAR